jgi:hypothetical protein
MTARWFKVTDAGVTAELRAEDADTARQLVANYSQQNVRRRQPPPGGIMMMSDGKPHEASELTAKAVERDPDIHVHVDGFVSQFAPD